MCRSQQDDGTGTDLAAPPPPAVDLARFFNPQSIALVGATDDVGKFGGRCFQRLVDFGYGGRIYAVNPTRREVRGYPCFGSIADLPEVPDHVGIVVPADRVLPVLEACAVRGVRCATVFSSGFAETGTPEGQARQARLQALVRATGLRVMGPNCNGFINFVDRLALTSAAAIAGVRPPAGTIGIVAHSGGIGQVNVMWRAQAAGLGISYQVSCGNDADLDALDFAGFMVESPATRVVLLALERIASGSKLAALATRAADLGKPLIALMAGRTEAGRRAAASHTGAIAGSDAVNDGAFRQLGIIRVEDTSELYETAALFGRPGRPVGRRVAAMSVSGGNTVLFADLAGPLGLECPPYAATTQARLAEALPGFGPAANPTDLTAAAIGGGDTYRRVLEILADDPGIDVMVPIVTITRRAEIESIAAVAAASDKPMPVLWNGFCVDDRSLDSDVFTDAGVPVYRDTLPLLRALARGAWYQEYHARRTPGAAVRPAGIDPAAARRLLSGSRALTERASKQLLAAYGLAGLRETLATSAEQAVRAAAAIGGPVAMKIESAAIPHKTEAGAVRLDVHGAGAVRQAFREIMTAARNFAPEAPLAGVLVQEMAPPGLEMILGLSHAPAFGPVVTVGIGGTLVEVLGDAVHRLPPLTAGDARAALQELRGRSLLGGVRGGPARDVEALCDAVVRLSWLAADLGEAIAELDVNPLVVLEAGAGVRVVDALVVPRQTTANDGEM